mmetsp:Transcript_115020/g.228987  ORF Transcript_115020/g.228987 Transcript_115020/m.228987 type:complete len:202 (-) Transcript_115020:762-1367(-)
MEAQKKDRKPRTTKQTNKEFQCKYAINHALHDRSKDARKKPRCYHCLQESDADGKQNERWRHACKNMGSRARLWILEHVPHHACSPCASSIPAGYLQGNFTVLLAWMDARPDCKVPRSSWHKHGVQRCKPPFGFWVLDPVMPGWVFIFFRLHLCHHRRRHNCLVGLPFSPYLRLLQRWRIRRAPRGDWQCHRLAPVERNRC